MRREEHPNPQFVRKNWINLNGTWEFETDRSASGPEREVFRKEHLSGTIEVPFCPESRLSGVGEKDFLNMVWYRRDVKVPPLEKDEVCLLHFGAVDYEAFVYIDGELCATHTGGYVGFAADITRFVRGKDTVSLCVGARDDSRDPTIPSGKQSGKFRSYGCYYTRTTGIWQTVYLETAPKDRILQFRFYPDPDNACVTAQVAVRGRGTLRAEVSFAGRKVGSACAEASVSPVFLRIPLSETHRWDLGQGNLYQVELTFGADTVETYFGLRTVEITPDGRFLLNGRSVFQRLVLDQGFYPDGVYTAPEREELHRDVLRSMALGFNGARLHQKVFEPLFLYDCDREGYMVWGEYASWGLDHTRDDALQIFLPQWLEAVERDFNHPAIIGWCPFNETWDVGGRRQNHELLRQVYRTTRRMDPTRPCIDTSGNYHVLSDVYDVHDYEQDPEIFKAHYDRLMSDGTLYDRVNKPGSVRQTYRGEPCFMSEYGGIRWAPEDSDGWGYGNAPKSLEEFYERYRKLTDALLDNKRMFGFCYTQLTDVEQEMNGMYTFDRQCKFDAEKIRAVNQRKAAIEEE